MFRMIELENYKRNVDVIDKFNVKNIKVNKAVVYSGNTHYINKHIKKKEHNSPLLAAAVLGLDNTAIPIPPKSKFLDIWTESDAQEIYLNTKPTCYLIIGKAGAGAYALGEAISKKFNCIHICPKNIIFDEIQQNSPTGKAWDFNMRHNKVCSFDMILKMLKIKLNSPAVQHRGYVISDLPLVTCSRNPLYYFNSLYSEEALLDIEEYLFDIICNLKKKKSKKPPESPHSSQSSELFIPGEEEEEVEEEDNVGDQQEEKAEEEEEEAPAVLPKFLMDPCSNVIISRKPYFKTKQAVLLYQVQELFKLCLTPDVIIHITCPDLDLVIKKAHRYLNYKTGQHIIEPFIPKVDSNLRWPPKYESSDYKIPHDPHVFNPKYNCRPPINFNERSIEQICNYKKYILPFMEKKLKDFKPKSVIELDGRTSVHQMLNHVSERLLLLHIQPVIIPEPLYLEEIPEDMEEFWSTIAETNVIRSDVINFRLYASPWFNRCPVELKLRRSVVGSPRYAVMFFKHVYLMSTLDNFILFSRNPRPFLKLKYLEPTCRIIVTGTKCSGKSMISQCLSWIFDVCVINFKTFVENEKQKKYETFAKTILSELIATIEDSRFQEWQRTELDRVTKFMTWCNSALELLNEYVPLLVKFLKHENTHKLQVEELHEQEEELKEEEITVSEADEALDSEFINNFNALKRQLSFLPILDSVEECETVLANRNILQYAPIELTTENNKPSIPVLGDEDVMVAISDYIAANDLQKELEPTTEEIMTEMVKTIHAVDTKHQKETNFEQSYGKYIIDGFPSDAEYWGYLHDSKLIPDYTIALIENREISEELTQYYINAENYSKYYDEKILLAKDPLITTRLISSRIHDLTESVITDMQILVNYFINYALDFIFIPKNIEIPEDSEASQTQFITSFSEAVDKFREDWDNIKLKLEDKSKVFIETELENKTDVQIIEDVLLKIRQGYCYSGELNENEEVSDEDEDDETAKDLLYYNDSKFFCETSIYCPVAYYDYGILWEGKPEFSLKLDNKIHNFCKEEFLEVFRKNITKYQSYNIPFKKLPTIKICVAGAIGSGTTTLSKMIAKELGLLHIDFADIINNYLMPRHFKNVGRNYENIFTDEPLDEEAVVEFQMDEENVNLVSDILSNETEMRRMLNNYLERGTPILSILMQKIIKKIWFEPFVSAGFILDGYPRVASDVEDMLACFCIPDVVIELESTADVIVERMTPIMLKAWKSQQNEAKKVAKLKLDTERKEWMHNITKKIVAKLIIEEIFDNMFFPPAEAVKGLSVESVIMDAHPTGSANVNPVLFNAYNEMIQEYPEPTETVVWEKSDEARERIEARIEGIFETDDENIQSLKDSLSEERIKILSVDATKPLNKVFRYTLFKLTNLKNRCESLFEQTFIIKPDIADILISRGFYFLSKFNRLCPVYLYENPETILNSYNISRRRGSLFPVIHRSYIYFICSQENVKKFRTNPLKYIINDALKSYFEYPLRIGVIGTRKSGQSTLAAKLAKRNGLLYISRGSAIRSVLENMHWTQLGSKIEKILRSGKLIEDDLIVKAIQTVAIDHRTLTYGFVFDGLPATSYEAKGLSKNGLYPNIIFDISSNKERILENSQNEIYYDILKYKPAFPHNLIEKRYENWILRRHKIRKWIMDEYQNLCPLNGCLSKWQILQDANDKLMQLCTKIHFYVSNVDNNIVRALWISNEAFEERQTQYKNLCPVCFQNNTFRHNGYPVDKKGVVQYKNKFYWICEEHVDIVMMYPHLYLTEKNIKIPEIATPVKIVNKDYVYEHGICLVTYAENLPAQIIKSGTNEFASSYGGKIYLFCSEECLRKFLAKPHFYNDIIVFRETGLFPKLQLKKLPNIGYLEQALGNILTEACCAVNVVRPKYPGLSFQLSALIYIALYLKTHNPISDELKKTSNLKALKVFEARSKLLLNVGLRLRSMDNPFANYPKCHHAEPTLRPVDIGYEPLSSAQIQRPSNFTPRTSNYVQMHKSSIIQPLHRSSTMAARRVPVPDERFDYLCEFHKPASKVPAFLNVVDIAGLVRGAAEGQGLGNAFLSHIKACDAIFNLCRAFDDEDVIHVDGDVNPIRDLETIGEELRLKDEEQLMQNFEKLDRVVNRGGDKKLKPEHDALTRIKAILVDEKKHIRFGDWSAADIEVLNKYLFLTSKPALYLVNLSEKDYIRKKNKWLPKLKEWIDKNDPGAPLIPFSGALETKLIEMDPAERQAFLKEHNITSALDKIIVQGYKALHLEYFFTAGPDEVKAWTIQKGTKAPQAAGRIHTDFEKGFIMAEVMHFKDFKEEGTEAACKAAGKYRQQGRNYVVEDGDIIFFKFNAGAGLKDAKKK